MILANSHLKWPLVGHFGHVYETRLSRQDEEERSGAAGRRGWPWNG
jgi:hypothetical protein